MKTKNNKMIGFRISKGILSVFFKLFFHPKIIGRGNIPETGGVILAGNHRHIFDPCMPIISTKRPVHYMAKKELFSGIFGWFFKLVGCISVDRGHYNTLAKNEAIKVLEEGKVLGIFPEGTRNKTNDILLPFKYGAVSMSKKTNAYIVPFAITGKYKLFNNDLTIKFGKAFIASSDLDEANHLLSDRIKGLILESSKKSGK